MKRLRTGALLIAMLCGCLAATACGGTGETSSAGTPTTGAATPSPTTAPKAKPASVPQITLAFCQGLMSVAEANQIMQPPTPATAIRIDSTPTGGSCNYEYAKFRSVVTVTFLPYKGQAGSPQAALAAAATQLTQVQGAQVTTTPVTGVGDAALFVTGAIASPPLRLAALDTIYGAIVLSCGNFNVGSATFASQQTALTRVCQQVISRL